MREPWGRFLFETKNFGEPTRTLGTKLGDVSHFYSVAVGVFTADTEMIRAAKGRGGHRHVGHRHVAWKGKCNRGDERQI